MSMEKFWTHPYDSEADSVLAPAERKRWYSLVSAMLDDMPDSREKWIACLAIGSLQTAGRSIEQMAKLANTSEDALLKSAAAFCERRGIHASPKLREAWQAKLGRVLAEPKA